MEPIGAKLKEARERKGMTLQEAKRELRIHGPYLEALEAGEFGKLPAPAYARAFLRQYAAFLGLDPQPLVDAYNAHAGNTPPALNVGWTAAPETRPGWGSWTATAVAGVVLGLALVGAYEVRSYLAGKEAVQRQAAMQSRRQAAAVPRRPVVRQPSDAPEARPGAGARSGQRATSGTPSGAAVTGKAAAGAAASRPAAPAAGNRPVGAASSPAVAGTPPGNASAPASASAGSGQAPASVGTLRPPANQPALESRPAPLAPDASGFGGSYGTPAPAGTPAAAGVEGAPKEASGSGVQVTVVARERCWVRVRSGGRTIYSGSLAPGESRSWQGSEAVGLTLGNAGGVRVSVNGQDVGPLGRPGQVVHRVFRATAAGTGT